MASEACVSGLVCSNDMHKAIDMLGAEWDICLPHTASRRKEEFALDFKTLVSVFSIHLRSVIHVLN